ncbi:MAG: hypothetical protein QM706_14695 [Nitrospira sp.]
MSVKFPYTASSRITAMILSSASPPSARLGLLRIGSAVRRISLCGILFSDKTTEVRGGSDPFQRLLGLTIKAHPWHGVSIREEAPEVVTAYIRNRPD